MKTETLPETAVEKADAEAVLRHAFHGEPLDPEIAHRVHERAAKITEEIYRLHGLINNDTFQRILDHVGFVM